MSPSRTPQKGCKFAQVTIKAKNIKMGPTKRL